MRRVIAEDQVVAVWMCPECGTVARVSPSFYEESGEPVCGNPDCSSKGEIMGYIHTQIFDDKMARLVDAVGNLLSTTELNLDEMETETVQAIREADAIVAKAKEER